MADVFVSYDRRDRELAEKVVSTLTEQGLTVWWDDRITPHETWDKTIEREVDSARRVLVLWTNNSVQSDWVRTEAGAAKESTPPKLIQARFADCKVPLAFRLLQHVDLIGWSPKKKHAGWDRLVGWLKADDAPSAAPKAAVTPAPKPVPAPAPTPQPAAPQAPMGFADMGGAASAAPATPTEPVTPTTGAVTGSAPAEGLENLATGASQAADAAMDAAKTAAAGAGAAVNDVMADPNKKKMLMIGGAVVGGLIVIAVLWMALSSMMGGGGSVGGGAANGVNGAGQATLGGYLDNYQERFAVGTREAGDDEFASLADGARHDYTVNLRGGREYTVLGACDTNCRDVDVMLLNEDNAIIASDFALDDHPVVRFTPESNGRYSVRIEMPNCTTGECLAAARVLEAG